LAYPLDVARSHFFRPDLTIISDEIWEKVQKRIELAKTIHPKVKKGKREGYSKTNPKSLLSGTLRCGKCEGTMAIVAGKKPGYFGCVIAHQRNFCSNMLKVPRSKLEKIFLGELFSKVLTSENLLYVYDKVEKEVKKIVSIAPKILKQKIKTRNRLEKEVNNMIRFIKAGTISESITSELIHSENQLKQINKDIQRISESNKKTFPPLPENGSTLKLVK